MFPYSTLLVAILLLPTSAARRGNIPVGGSSINDADDNQLIFDAPRLEKAHLAVYGIFLLVALIQFAIVLSALFRPGARLPAAGAAIALAVLAVANALGVALVVTSYTINDEGFQHFSGSPFISLQIAASLFYDWTNPFVSAAVALVLYTRYRALKKSSSAAFIAFVSAGGVLLVLSTVLTAVRAGIYGTAQAVLLRNSMMIENASRDIQISSNIFDAFVGCHIFGTLLITVAAFLVKACTKDDPATSMTLFSIIPFLLLHALARLIFVILQARVFLTDPFNRYLVFALDFASTFVFGVMYVAAMSVLVFIIVRPHLWNSELSGEPTHSFGATGAIPET